jgi:DNA segregation ATPase FtsK/SpoIIIE, S-DNA-T family
LCFARAPREVKRNYPLAWKARIRWSWLTKSLGLVLADKHQTVIDRKVIGPRLVSGERVKKQKHRTRTPGVRIRPTAHGIEVRVKAIPTVGREQIEKAAPHLANYWRCERVSVSQPKPGRLIVRGLRFDPLHAPLSLAESPSTVDDPWRVWLGRDECGTDRYLDLRNVSGICVGGQPGGGKSQAITSWFTQLAPRAEVQFVTCDGKGADEFSDLAPRAWITAGDSMDGALDILEKLAGLMYGRLACVRDFTGGRKNIWTAGVSAEWPLIFTVLDETQTWFDLPAAKALGKDEEKAAARAIKLAGELVRKGRSVGMCTVVSTQKPTTDSLPSSVSSNCALSLAFSLKTLDAARATLGADIGNYPSVSPVTLSLPEHAGVCVATLKDGMIPFTRLRSPMVTEDQAAAAATASAHLRRNPVALLDALPDLVPDTAEELLDVEA